MKLKTAMTYRFIYQLKSLGIFYLYFVLFTLIFPAMALFVAGGTLSSQSDLMFPAIIFAFIVALIGIQTDFKFFIQNAMNRLHILLTNILTNFVISNIIALTMLLFYQVFKSIALANFHYMFLLIDQYNPKQPGFYYGFLLAFIFFATTLGALCGLFFDRFSTVVRLIIGAGVILLPFLFGTIFTSLSHAARQEVVTALGHLIGISDKGLNAAPLLMTILVLTVINIIIIYLMNHRRELRRIS